MKKKIALMATSLVLVAALAVGGTLAYLTSHATVTNTFTVGNVAITLDEAKVNEVGEKVDKEGNILGENAADVRVTDNEYKLMPGHTYVKDPTIHVDANSEDCYLFVKVENGISGIEASDNNIASQLTSNGWNSLEGNNGVYYYTHDGQTIVSVGDNNDYKVFDSFTINGDADVSDCAGATIEITAYAVQADGFNTPDAAWEATFGASEAAEA